jgi:hypothetical protein
MTLLYGLLILLVLLLLWYSLIGRYSPINTTSAQLCSGGVCSNYNVHREHDDQHEAAQLISEIERRTDRLLNHLSSRYLQDSSSFDSNRAGLIDIVPMSGLYSVAEPSSDGNGMSGLSAPARERVQERVRQLIKNYGATTIYEISPLNGENLTSYTQDKKDLVLCLRRKEPNAAGQHPLHDINTMMFVVLHELTHMMNDTWGHPSDFWMLFRFMLEASVEADVYRPVDYSKHPVIYCGLNINYSPYFDTRLIKQQK